MQDKKDKDKGDDDDDDDDDDEDEDEEEEEEKKDSKYSELYIVFGTAFLPIPLMATSPNKQMVMRLATFSRTVKEQSQNPTHHVKIKHHYIVLMLPSGPLYSLRRA